jgi:TetR/AcrR family transcriptional regulator, transcriptional repressor for nem operon
VTTKHPTPKLTARGAATKARIVAATADLVLERGAAGTSLDDVMMATGTSRSQLYHYFSDKADLLRAVMQEQTQRVMQDERPELDALDSIAGLRRWRDRIIENLAALDYAFGCPLGSLANELADSNARARQMLQACFDEWEVPLRAGLTAMRDKGRIRPDADPAAVAEAIMAALQGGLLLAKTYRSSRPLARALDMAIDHVRSLSTADRGKP